MPETLNVLIVEDNAAERALLDAELDACPGLARRWATSLHEAWQLIAAAPPDVVLLDLELPDARGLRGVEWLHKRHPELAIVVLSGFAADDLLVATEAIRLGAQDFLCKGRIEAERLCRTLSLAVARKQRERHAVESALRDPLTGLPRLPQLAERFQRSIARGARSRSRVALLHIAVDGHAALRDELGADRVDALVAELAARLARHVRKTDALVRLDDAGFVALIDGMPRDSDAEVVARKLLALTRTPFAGDPPPTVRLSIGIAAHDGAGDFESLLDAADAAMREARRRGGDRCATAPAPALAVA